MDQRMWADENRARDDDMLRLHVIAAEGLAARIPGKRDPIIFIFWPAGSIDPVRHRAIRLRVAGTQDLIAELGVWLEYHGEKGKRGVSVGRPIITRQSPDDGERLMLLDPAAMHRAVSELGAGRFQIYVSVAPLSGLLAIREVHALG